MPAQVITVSTSPYTTKGPGLYAVTIANATINLETWSDFSTSLTVKDMTGAPGTMTINAPQGGLIDGSASTTITNAYEALTFRPYQGAGTNWVIS